jgi:FeS assembly SUF system protein
MEQQNLTTEPSEELEANAAAPVNAVMDDEDFPPPPFLKAPVDHPLYPQIAEALKEVYDPEIPVNIFELGLIYNVMIDAENVVDIKMTLTAPGCPVAGEMPVWVTDAVQAIEAVKSANVEIIWDPPWTPDMMSEFAKMELGMF